MLARSDERPFRLAADGIDPQVQSLCDEFEITIIPKSRAPMPGETRAVASIARLIRKYGADHARLVLCVLAEGKGNSALIDEMSLVALSDILRACPDIVESSTSELLELFDTIPLGPYMAVANELRGKVHQGHALAGMVYLHVRRLRETSATAKATGPERVRHANLSEVEKGRTVFARGGYRSEGEKIEIGRKLLDVKAKLPWGHFGPWLRDKSGLSAPMALQCMRMART